MIRLGNSWENADSESRQQENEEDNDSVKIHREFRPHLSTVSRISLGCAGIQGAQMNTRLTLFLARSELNKITTKGGCHCLLPIFRAHPVTHLLSFILGRKRRRKTLHNPTEEQLPSSTIQTQALLLNT